MAGIFHSSKVWKKRLTRSSSVSFWLTKKTFEVTVVILSTGLVMWRRWRKSWWIPSDINAAKCDRALSETRGASLALMDDILFQGLFLISHLLSNCRGWMQDITQKPHLTSTFVCFVYLVLSSHWFRNWMFHKPSTWHYATLIFPSIYYLFLSNQHHYRQAWLRSVGEDAENVPLSYCCQVNPFSFVKWNFRSSRTTVKLQTWVWQGGGKKNQTLISDYFLRCGRQTTFEQSNYISAHPQMFPAHIQPQHMHVMAAVWGWT